MSESLVRYGIVLILARYGLFKFAYTEAGAIQPLISHSPLMSWVYQIGSVDGVSRFVGGVKLMVALLLIVKPIWPRLSVLGSVPSSVIFLTTLTFLLSTPGIITKIEWL